MTLLRQLIRTNGVSEQLDRPHSVTEICALIGAEALDTVVLADRMHVMVVDDLGHYKHLPINRAATVLYWEKCGTPNRHVIRGDVVIAPDSDFGSDQ
ncbi:DUF3846 domain-containing protein [Cupriavidus alkaliphilus]|uniref:DUF3846 domain-containing protein n=1 Tax=Cupriavidus alkaliphilus TaxID=942866 RepID=UPI00160E611B|nr:hypothetical protein [Cupriavidus alkaliphilus]MBB2918302.1 hypothetical protein [Cupriavidus alkaliphilus]